MESIINGYERILMIAVVTLVIGCIFLYQCWRIHVSTWSHIPFIGAPLPIIGNLLLIPPKEGFMKWFDTLYGKLGCDSFLIWISFRPVLFTRDNKIFEKLLSSSEYNKKASGYLFLRDWVQDGLICSNGDKWFKRRKQLTGCFHFDVLKSYLSIMETHSLQLVQKLKTFSGLTIENIQDYTKPYSLGIICDSAMGVDLKGSSTSRFNQDQIDVYIKSIEFLTYMTNCVERNPLYWWKPLFQRMAIGQKYYKSIDTMNSFVRKVIEEKIAFTNFPMKKNVSDKSDRKMNFLDTLLFLYEKGEIDVDGLIEEMNNFIFAGHDTVSTTLSWAIYNLGRNKSIQEKAYEEAKTIERMDGGIDTKLKQMKFLDCIVKETLRVRPTVVAVSRQMEKDVEVNNVVIPRGTEVAFDFSNLHRNEKVWENPRKFIPERFEDKEKSDSAYSFVPFSAGPRNCIGQRFAMMELKISLHIILLNFVIDAEQKEDEIVEVVDVVMTSLEGLKIKFTERT